MATVGIIAGDPDHILVAAVPKDLDPAPTLSVWIGRDAVTDVSLDAAEELVRILSAAIEISRGERPATVLSNGNLAWRAD